MTNVPNLIEISQLICNANPLTGFYIMENIGCSVVNNWSNFSLSHMQSQTKGCREIHKMKQSRFFHGMFYIFFSRSLLKYVKMGRLGPGH